MRNYGRKKSSVGDTSISSGIKKSLKHQISDSGNDEIVKENANSINIRVKDSCLLKSRLMRKLSTSTENAASNTSDASDVNVKQREVKQKSNEISDNDSISSNVDTISLNQSDDLGHNRRNNNVSDIKLSASDNIDIKNIKHSEEELKEDDIECLAENAKGEYKINLPLSTTIDIYDINIQSLKW